MKKTKDELQRQINAIQEHCMRQIKQCEELVKGTESPLSIMYYKGIINEMKWMLELHYGIKPEQEQPKEETKTIN